MSDLVQKLRENLPAELAFDAQEKFGIVLEVRWNDELEVRWNDEKEKWTVIKNHEGHKAHLQLQEKYFIHGYLQGYQVAILAVETLIKKEAET
jgi:hypothetical protein